MSTNRSQSTSAGRRGCRALRTPGPTLGVRCQPCPGLLDRSLRLAKMPFDLVVDRHIVPTVGPERWASLACQYGHRKLVELPLPVVVLDDRRVPGAEDLLPATKHNLVLVHVWLSRRRGPCLP